MKSELLKVLKQNADKTYADFQAKLTPSVDREKFIGVRVPVVRKIAKQATDEQIENFITKLPHEYYDENMLHGLILSNVKDYNTCLTELEKFLPYVDNWAVCDIMSPKVFAKNKLDLIEKIKVWVKSDKTYTIRFGIEMLMSHFLDKEFKKEYLQIPLTVKSNEYYVNMILAWFYATALAKQWDATIPIIESKLLLPWVHNKTIQKSIESYRITNEQKEYLRKLKSR